MNLKEILTYILHVIVLIFVNHGRGFKYSCGSKCNNQLGVDITGAGISHKKSVEEQGKKRKSTWSSLCCFSCRDGREQDSREDRAYYDQGIEDRGIRINLACCSNTWSTSSRELD